MACSAKQKEREHMRESAATTDRRLPTIARQTIRKMLAAKRYWALCPHLAHKREDPTRCD